MIAFAGLPAGLALLAVLASALVACRRPTGVADGLILLGLLLGALAPEIGSAWAGLAIAAMAGGWQARSWRAVVFGATALMLAAAGLVVVAQAAPDARLSWDGMATIAAHMRPGLADVGGVLLMAGVVTMALVPPLTWIAEPVRAAVLSSLALTLLLRTCRMLATVPGALPPGTVAALAGTAAMVLAGLALWRAEPSRVVGYWVVLQLGLAALAVGVAAPDAALLPTLLLAPLGAVVLGRPARLGVMAAIGIPPSGLFWGQAGTLARAATEAPWLFLPAALGLLTGNLALLARVWAEPEPGWRGRTPSMVALSLLAAAFFLAWP